MDDNKKIPEEATSESKSEFDFVIEDPYAGKAVAQASSGHHHHHHHHHSSHHGRHGGRKKKHSTHKKAKGFKEPSIRFLTGWIAIVTLVCVILCAWNVELSSSLKSTSDKLKMMIANGDISSPEVSGDDVKNEKIPSYVKNEAERVIDTVSKLVSEDTVTFLAVSEIHFKSDDQRVIESIRHAGQAMQLIREGLEIDFAVNLGDITWGSEDTPIETGISEIQAANDFLSEAFDGIPNFRTVGNHDLMLYSYAKTQDYLDTDELHNLIGKYNEGSVLNPGAENRGYCYRDFEDSKLRVISMNFNEYKDGIIPENLSDSYVSPTQAAWLISSLDLSSKADASDWKIVLLSHQPINWFDEYGFIVDILDGYSIGHVGTVTVDGVELPYDFQGKNSAHIIASFNGHLHNFKTDNIGIARIPTITIPNACFLRNNEYGTAYTYSEEIQNKYGEKTTYEKTANSAEDTAFSVVTIDLKYNRIYVTNYGAGYDRDLGF